jgi:hypothetical protein
LVLIQRRCGSQAWQELQRAEVGFVDLLMRSNMRFTNLLCLLRYFRVACFQTNALNWDDAVFAEVAVSGLPGVCSYMPSLAAGRFNSNRT